MFTMQNTDGYTQRELDALNAELAERMANVEWWDTDRRNEIEKAFSDEVAQYRESDIGLLRSVIGHQGC